MRTVLLLALLALTLSVPLEAAAAPAGGSTAVVAKKKAKKKRCKKATKRARGKAKSKKCRKAAAKKKPAAPRAPGTPITVAPPRIEGGVDDAVVIAVLDSGINPYHFDFSASRMPQHQDAIPENDLPLGRPATEWLPGVAGAGFKEFERVELHLSDDPKAKADSLVKEDPKLTEATPSTPDAIHGYWFPGTKIIGAVNFSDDGDLWLGDDAHGVGTTSSAVGNLHGTCPECLLLFVDFGDSAAEGEAAIDWVMKQPWIDAISNSYGYSLAVRDRVYSGSSTDVQKSASERGQTVFFSAGNGNDGAFYVPNTTTYSSQEGPDWIVTVGAVSPPDDAYYDPIADPEEEGQESSSYTGAGKPADVAGIGADYPTAYTAAEIGATGDLGFGGTSNATPQLAGLYGRALYLSRVALRGPSRSQEGGVIASGDPVACGAERPGCELADGRLTAAELRTRMFHGAVHTGQGMGVYGQGVAEEPSVPPVGEDEFLNEGHGSYMGRVSKDGTAWLREFGRFFDPILGTKPVLQRPDGELEWMIVDSYCRQENWGAWSGGYYVEGQTQLPGDDDGWPVRSMRERTCPGGGAG
jgi:hypothetical protein